MVSHFVSKTRFYVTNPCTEKDQKNFVGCFPGVIPRKTEKRTAEERKNSSTIHRVEYGTLKELPSVIWKLLTNPTYMLINLGNIFFFKIKPKSM